MKGLLKGFWWPFILSKSVKYSQSYGPNEVCDTIQKLYNHVINFVKSTMLPKPAKVYLLSLAEKNSLDTWIDEKLRKGYIQLSTSPIAAPFFFVKKHDGSL